MIERTEKSQFHFHLWQNHLLTVNSLLMEKD